MSQPFNYTGPPPPNGYGFQITSQGDKLLGKNLICHACGALIPDESFFLDSHNLMHRNQKLLLETIEHLTAEVKKLRAQYLITEEP